MFNIEGKKVILTGGAQGLGFAMVKAFYEAGAEIAVIDISDDVHKVSEKLGDTQQKIHAIQEDLLDLNKLRHAFELAFEKLNNKVDILVNNAGLMDRQPALEVNIESWNRILNLNVTSVFELSRLAAEAMKVQHYGKIINMGSILSILGGYNAVAYSTSKGAILQLTKSLSNEWAGYGIQVNAIAPGYMLTEMNTALVNDPVRAPQIEARIPAKRWGTAEDVTGVALFLASHAADYVTGVLIPVDGGVLGR